MKLPAGSVQSRTSGHVIIIMHAEIDAAKNRRPACICMLHRWSSSIHGSWPHRSDAWWWWCRRSICFCFSSSPLLSCVIMCLTASLITLRYPPARRQLPRPLTMHAHTVPAPGPWTNQSYSHLRLHHERQRRLLLLLAGKCIWDLI